MTSRKNKNMLEQAQTGLISRFYRQVENRLKKYFFPKQNRTIFLKKIFNTFFSFLLTQMAMTVLKITHSLVGWASHLIFRYIFSKTSLLKVFKRSGNLGKNHLTCCYIVIIPKLIIFSIKKFFSFK